VNTGLPDDTEALKRMLVRSQAELVEARLTMENLKLQFLHYKRTKFGASSKRLTKLAQFGLLVEELESEYAAIERWSRKRSQLSGTPCGTVMLALLKAPTAAGWTLLASWPSSPYDWTAKLDGAK
jgi:hypothetical protein